MKFGLCFEQSVSKPITPEKEHRVYKQGVEQVVLAEQLGFDQAWIAEHHFLESYSHASAPDVFLAYCAAKTEKIRLGHGVRIILPEVNHPVRAASAAAYLDQISDGRLEFGTGRQSTWVEMGGFGVQPDQTKEQWDEIVRAIPRMWTQEDFAWDGKYFQMPERPVYPKPYQQPHPPIWVAVQSPETAVQAAERGLGFLGVSSGNPARYEPLVSDYRRIIQNCDPVGSFVNEQVNAFTWMYCAPTEEEAKEGLKAANAFYSAAGHIVGVGSIYPGPGYSAGANAAGASLGSPERVDRPVGTPDQCIAAIKQWEEIGIDRMLFLIQFDQIVPQEKILSSMRLFAEQVMPHFQEEDATPMTTIPEAAPARAK